MGFQAHQHLFENYQQVTTKNVQQMRGASKTCDVASGDGDCQCLIQEEFIYKKLQTEN
jgi:hypothetical protein